MGPSGCGKTTIIRCINRMHELIPGATIDGKIYLRNKDIYAMEPIVLRRKVGMVFQKPNPFPTMSIYDNVIAGYKLNGIRLSERKPKKSWNGPSKRPPYGTRSRIPCTERGPFCPEASNKGFASPGPWP